MTAITIFTEGSGYHSLGEGVVTTTGEFTVTSSTLATKFGRLLISTLPPVVLLTMLSTVTDGQAIDKERSVKDAGGAKHAVQETSLVACSVGPIDCSLGPDHVD